MPVIEPGYTEIHLPYTGGSDAAAWLHVHGGVVGMIADSAAGYAANTLTSADTGVLTVEYKLNLLAPADGQLLIAEGIGSALRAHTDRHESGSLRRQGWQEDLVCADAADHHGAARQEGRETNGPTKE
jgi:acyl-coenzyme A thioesterase PaaI-like protein